MERGRREVRSKLNKDAEHVTERQPLVCPVSAAIPKIDYVDIARQRFAWLTLATLKPKYLGECKGLNPPVAGVSGDICRSSQENRCCDRFG